MPSSPPTRRGAHDDDHGMTVVDLYGIHYMPLIALFTALIEPQLLLQNQFQLFQRLLRG